MKKTYLDNLAKELDLVHAKNKDEILKKYEKRYDFGLESGLSEEEIENKLGKPSDVAKEYQESNEEYAKFDDEKETKNESKKGFKLVVHTVNDIIRTARSNDKNIHIKFDFDDYDNYKVINNHEGVIIDYHKTKYFALNRKKPGEILIEIPDNEYFDLVDIMAASGNIILDNINCKRTDIHTTSGNIDINYIKANSIGLTTVSGEISSNTLECEKISLSTVSGKVEINEALSSLLVIDTISGDIIVNKTESKITTSSITGNIVVNGEEFKNLKKYVKGVFKK